MRLDRKYRSSLGVCFGVRSRVFSVLPGGCITHSSPLSRGPGVGAWSFSHCLHWLSSRMESAEIEVFLGVNGLLPLCH